MSNPTILCCRNGREFNCDNPNSEIRLVAIAGTFESEPLKSAKSIVYKRLVDGIGIKNT